MATVDDLKQSRFLSKKDVASPILVTIKGYEQMNVARDRDEPDMRYVLYFREDYKPMTLNITNGQLIAAITGSRELDDWIGHKIVLFFDPNVSFGSELVGGIRCRAPRTQPAPSAEDVAAQEVMDGVAEAQESGGPEPPNGRHNPRKFTHEPPKEAGDGVPF